MSASANQSSLNSTSNSSSNPTPAMSVGSATAYGHGSHPNDKQNTNAGNSPSLPNNKLGAQKEDLEGEQMRAAGEGDVMNAQFEKKNAGWGEEASMTSDLDRKKEEQKQKRDQIKSSRETGEDVDGSGGGRIGNEGLDAV